MSIGFMLSNKDDPVIWRGPRKNGLIKQFLTDVMWDDLDYLLIDTPPGTSDEHISVIQYLKKANVHGAIIFIFGGCQEQDKESCVYHSNSRSIPTSASHHCLEPIVERFCHQI